MCQETSLSIGLGNKKIEKISFEFILVVGSFTRNEMYNLKGFLAAKTVS